MTGEHLRGSEARAALEEVEKQRRAALRAVAPPRWLIAAAALYAGGMIAIQALEDPARDLVMLGLALIFFGGLIVFRRRAQALKRRFGGGPGLGATIALIVGGVAVAILIFGAVDIAQDRYGYGWAPLPGGALLFALIMGLGELKRSSLLAGGA